MPGAQYCLSSDPLSKKEYFFIFFPIREACKAMSAKEFSALELVLL